MAGHWWRAIDALYHDVIADGVIYELSHLCDELEGVQKNTTAGLPDGFVALEANRILDRKRTQRGNRLIHERVRDFINERVVGADAAQQIAALRLLTDELYIARKILPSFELTRTEELKRWEGCDADTGWLTREDEPQEKTA